jgi:hypothetical protein
LDPPRARLLERLTASPAVGEGAVTAPEDPTRTVADFVLAQLEEAGARLTDVVFDHGAAGLHALLSFEQGDGSDVIACTAQEGVELAARTGLAMYASDEALGRDEAEPDPAGRPTLH